MLARRVIALSPDKRFAKRLVLGLKSAGGTVESYGSVDSLAKGQIQASLVVLHLEGELADALPLVTARLRDDAWIIVVLPKSDLNMTVSVMQTTDQLANVLIADQMSIAQLAAAATRVLHGDIFGLEKLVPWGVKIYSMLVGDYQEKSICISQISEYAALMGVRRKYREAIEQCADEMLMNALYDAPVDSEGKQLFADVPTKTRISLRMEQKAVVQYGCDGDVFWISVRDSFGALNRSTVLRYLHKCLHSDQQIDRKTGGAGLGLYIMCNATTQFLFNVLPGVATECVCKFDLTAPKVQLKDFGFFREKIDAAGRLVGGASKLLPSGAAYPVERRDAPPAPSTRGITIALSGAIMLLLALIGLVAYPRFTRAPTGAVQIATTPPQAQIEVDGQIRGTTTNGTLRISTLEVGRAYRVKATRPGYTTAETIIQAEKGRTPSITLTLAPLNAKVFLDSDPADATVTYEDRALGKTPLTVTDLPPGKTVEVSFSRTGYRTVTRRLRVPSAGGEAFVSTTMTMAGDFGSIAIKSSPSGSQVYQNGELLAGVKTPVAEHLIQSGKSYKFTLKAPGFMPDTFNVELAAGERGVTFVRTLAPGGGLSVKGNITGRVVVAGRKNRCSYKPLPLDDCPLANGTYKVSVVSSDPFTRSDPVKIVIKGNMVNQTFDLGIVRAAKGWKLSRRGRLMRKTAYNEGTRRLLVIKDDTKEKKRIKVRIQPGKTLIIP